MKVGAPFLAVLIAKVTSACCALAPCDRLSILVGHVSTSKGAAISGAKIAAYGHNTTTDVNGCFEVGGIEMGRHQLQIAALGFEPLTVPARTGMYEVDVILAPQGSSLAGSVRWSKLRRGRSTTCRAATDNSPEQASER